MSQVVTVDLVIKVQHHDSGEKEKVHHKKKEKGEELELEEEEDREE